MRKSKSTVRVRPGFRELRWAQAWTQEMLAEKAGVVKSTIENIEADKNVLFRTASKVAEAIGIDIKELFIFEDLVDFPLAPTDDAVSRESNPNPAQSPDQVGRSSNGSLHHDVNSTIYDFENDHEVEQFVEACQEAHLKGDYIAYNKMLNRYSLALKKKGRHKELSQICELDVYRKYPHSLYPALTYSQCKLVTYDLTEAFDALNRRLQWDPKLEKWSPLTRLTFARTYSEILNADGAYDLAANILETFLSPRSIERITFPAVCQSLGVLGRSYLGKGDILTALDLFEATLLDQTLTANKYGISIAKMNLGTALLAHENHNDARHMFEDAMETFRGLDDRAYAWAQLNLAIAVSRAGVLKKYTTFCRRHWIIILRTANAGLIIYQIWNT